jgi:hypothetical protein
MEDIVYKSEGIDNNELKLKYKQLLLLDQKRKDLKEEKNILNAINKKHKMDIRKKMEEMGLDSIKYKDITFEIKTRMKKQTVNKKYLEMKTKEFLGNKENAETLVKHLYNNDNRYKGTKTIIKRKLIKEEYE